MNEIIQIKCPFCGAVLSVKNQPGMESKSVTCPVCKHKYLFTEFKRVSGGGSSDDDDTDYPGGNGGDDDNTRYDDDDKTSGLLNPNLVLGKLVVVGTGTSFQLRPGRNVIGRKAQKSAANFQLATGESRAMSREHIVVEAKRVPGKGFVHYLSLFKEKVNDTFHGNEQLLFGDCIVLKHGDIIKLPDAKLRFEIPDDEGTEI